MLLSRLLKVALGYDVAVEGGATDNLSAHRPLDKHVPRLYYEEYLQETGKNANREFPIYKPCHLALAKPGIPSIEVAGGLRMATLTVLVEVRRKLKLMIKNRLNWKK